MARPKAKPKEPKEALTALDGPLRLRGRRKIIQDATFIAASTASARLHAMPSRGAIWLGILVGSTLGGLVPLLWGGEMLSYSGVLLSGIGAFIGLWVAVRR
jgi:hypothetical protein